MKNNYLDESKENNAPFGIQLPIQLEQENGSNLWTWRFKGIQMRNHFSSGFWFSEDGKHVFWAWQDQEKHQLTSLKAVEILSVASVRQYVEVKRKSEQTWKQYVDEAVCTCFHAKPQLGQFPRHIDGNLNNDAADNLQWDYPSSITV